ncbi:MAG: STAS domain-containing protein [Bacteroidales bacterium]|nr:STAS domain-containing protein [Bacteroidales bacterium]
MLQLNEYKAENHITIEVEGRLDTSTYSQLEEKLNEIINAGTLNVIVCLQNMEYVSSSGLRVFLMMLKKMKALNGKFFLCGLRPNVKEIFEIAGFSTIFQIFESREEALNHL